MPFSTTGFLEKIKKNKWELIVLIIILSLGIFFRTYHFSRWLHFEIDQTYDTYITSNAVQNGISRLPLLGPTASGGRSLRLGPAFYYMEYASASVFGDNPTGHAMGVLILCLAALPLFYIFCRRFFNVHTSLCLLAVFSTSLYMVVYSRFSWSPNALPFLILFSFYALLRCVSQKEERKNLWFLLMIVAVTVTTQIHFNAFFMIPAIVALFLLIRRPKFSIKIWGAALAIVLLIYSPLILSEIKTHGQDINFFMDKLDDKSGFSEKNPMLKASRDIQYNMYEYFLVISGQDQINGAHEDQENNYALGLSCRTCQNGIVWKIIALLYFLSGLALLTIGLLKERDEERRNFYILLSLWFLMSLVLYFALLGSFRMKPRFFLPISPLAILLLGLILEKITQLRIRAKYILTILITLFLSFTNVQGVLSYFDKLAKNISEPQLLETEDVFPIISRLTLEEQLIITDYIESKYKENGYPVYLKSLSEFEPVFWYHLEKEGITYHDDLKEADIYKEGNYFIISAIAGKVSSRGPVLALSPSYNVIEKKVLGSMVVYYLSPKDEFITSDRQNETEVKTTLEKRQISEIETWNKLLK